MQAYANMQNAQTDFVIGVVNLSLIQYNSALGIYNALAGTDYQLGITAPDWSRGLFWDEPGEAGEWNDTHGWSKFAAGVSLESGLAAATLGGSAAGSTSLRQIPGKVAGYAKSLPGKAQNAWAGIKSWWKGTPKTSQTTVLGHHPGYTELAEQLNANHFSLADDVWKAMTPDDIWKANKQFLDEVIKRGDDVRLSVHFDDVKKGSYLEKELAYLQSNGYVVSPDGLWLIKR